MKKVLQSKTIKLLLWVSIPLLFMYILLNFMIILPLRQTYQENHVKNMSLNINNLDIELNQLEVLFSFYGQSFKEDVDRYQDLEAFPYELINQLSDNLFYLSNSHRFVSNAEIVDFSQNPFIISQGGTYPISNQTKKNMEKKFHPYKDIKYEWINLGNELYFVERILQTKENDKAILLKVRVDKQLLFDELNRMNAQSGMVAVSFTPGRIESKQSSNISWLNKYKKSEEVRYNKRFFSLTVNKMNRLKQEWIIYSIAPTDKIIAPAIRIKDLLLIITMTSVIVIIILNVLYTKKVYQPFTDAINKVIGDENRDKKDEVNYFITKWQELLEDRKQLDILSQEYDVANKRNIIRRILDGYYTFLSNEELLRLLNENQWNGFSENMDMFYIQINDTSISDDKHSVDEMSFFAFENIVSDLCSEYFYQWVSLPRGDMSLLVVAEGERKRDTNLEFIQRVMQELNRVIGNYVSVSFNDKPVQLSNLSFEYKELVNAINYQKMKKENQYFTYKDVYQPTKYNVYSISDEREILLGIKNGDSAMLKSAVNKFYQSVYISSQTLNDLLFVTSKLYESIELLAKENGLSHREYLSKKIILSRISKIISIQEIVDFINDEFLVPFSIVWNLKVKTSNLAKMNEICDFIKKEYMNEQLSLEFVAEKFHLSPTLLSKEFKKQKNTNFVDYVSQIKLSEAKRLLVESDLKISVIAENLGYNDSYFNRLFKKHEGVTPGQYRKNNKRF
ncbi:AraC family transcriptional regulator [Enterococcus columbae]|nr:AraC family transcriptional regulator [Enterococcus columbae]OJG21016.1 hypothetical protein RR47_GL001485 [Enterococcus columbae DSM 7374 = ATCC 51263]